jgi:hypothetical protein
LAADGAEIEPGYGWLAAVIPVGARRFRALDPVLAAVVSEAGAELVSARPDVEIAPARELRGDAVVSIGLLGRAPRPGRPLPVRAARRLAHSMHVRLEARGAAAGVRGLGYPAVRTLMWDHGMVPHASAGSGLRSRLVECLPQRALVLGARSRSTHTLLDGVLAEASRATGLDLAARPSVRAELLVVVTKDAVLRVAVGPGRRQILTAHAALATLHAADTPPFVAARIPTELAVGRYGLGEWSVESRLTGVRAPCPVRGRLLAECVDFLVALHSVCRSETGISLREQAEFVANACPSEDAQAIEELADRLEDTIAHVPRGFVHGDFCPGNLLVDRGRLAGVVDWDAAGAGRLPLLDLLHLRLCSLKDFADVEWGAFLLRHLLPWARDGGDGVAAE